MKHLLFLTHRLPYPPDKGERTRAFHEIQVLGREFRITVACPIHRPQERPHAAVLAEHCHDVIAEPVEGGALLRGGLSMLRGGSATEAFFYSRSLMRALRERAARDPFDAVLAYSSGVLPMALQLPAAAHLADLVDADSAKWSAYAAKSSPLLRWFYRAESRGVARLEQRALEACQAVFVVSAVEASLLPRGGHVIVASNGVDLDYFRPSAPVAGPRLVFTGQMDYLPNVQGVCWFVRHVWPQVRQKVPQATLVIAGREPTRRVRALAGPDVTVTGAVPDIRPHLAAAAVAIVPLQIARGVSNKVLEAMAMGKCVVATGPALEGLEVAPGDNVLRADSPEEWVATLTRALVDGPLRTRIERGARHCVETLYTWERQLAPLVERCRQV